MVVVVIVVCTNLSTVRMSQRVAAVVDGTLIRTFLVPRKLTSTRNGKVHKLGQ